MPIRLLTTFCTHDYKNDAKLLKDDWNSSDDFRRKIVPLAYLWEEFMLTAVSKPNLITLDVKWS